MFITFEGGEGAGKSTQIALLADRIKTETGRVDILITREPGDGPLGEHLRRLVLSPPDKVTVDPKAELLIMLADRAQHVAQTIQPYLDNGGIVLCDRYIDSSRAYQGHGRGLDTQVIALLNEFTTDGLLPHLTMLLDIDPRVGLARQPNRTRMEEETLPFHRRIRNGFLALASEFPIRIITVDASRSQEAVHEQIWGAVAQRLLSSH